MIDTIQTAIVNLDQNEKKQKVLMACLIDVLMLIKKYKFSGYIETIQKYLK